MISSITYKAAKPDISAHHKHLHWEWQDLANLPAITIPRPKAGFFPVPYKTGLLELWIANINPASYFVCTVSENVVTYALDPETVQNETGG